VRSAGNSPPVRAASVGRTSIVPVRSSQAVPGGMPGPRIQLADQVALYRRHRLGHIDARRLVGLRPHRLG